MLHEVHVHGRIDPWRCKAKRQPERDAEHGDGGQREHDHEVPDQRAEWRRDLVALDRQRHQPGQVRIASGELPGCDRDEPWRALVDSGGSERQRSRLLFQLLALFEALTQQLRCEEPGLRIVVPGG